MMTIRKATVDDFEKISEFSKQAVLHHVENRPDIIRSAPELSKKEFRQTIKDKKSLLFVAEVNGEVVGYSKSLIRTVGNEVWTPATFIFVYEMYVAPSFRYRGIANTMLDEIKKTAKEVGASKIELDVWSFNEAAIRLYEKSGFTPQRIKMELKI